jgi:hypothetical protein
MKEPYPIVIRVRDWNQLYENNRSRELGRTAWFPAPNDLGADWYAELVSAEDGAAHLGVWYALLMVASRVTPRGALVRGDGQAHTAESLARLTRLPEQVIIAAIERLLEIGLLEVGGNKPRKKSNLGSHPRAGNLQEPTRKAHEGAVETKGTEHHHQEKKRKGKEEKRTEPDGTDGAREQSTTERSDAHSGVGSNFPENGDDEGEHPEDPYASPEDELKAIYQSKSGEPITIDLLSSIRSNLELTLISMDDFVLEVRKHARNDWRNPPGFLRDLSKRFRAKTRPAGAPVTEAQAEESNYRCPRCSSRVRGEGVIFDASGTTAPCSCASLEYIARQRARGVFTEENPQ